MSGKRTAVIIGAGPAGLTAAWELLQRSEVVPVVLECSAYMGGIARTVDYRGNRIDIGGHRFFSKSDRVMEWWQNILPMEPLDADAAEITYHGRRTTVAPGSHALGPEETDRVMLVRSRRSRIYYLRKFFAYPISLSFETLRNLGVARSIRIGLSYLRSALFPVRPPRNLEDFFINRFGRELYGTFFKDYTEKVWGTPCHEISAEWGAQRVKGLSVSKAVLHFMSGPFRRRGGDIAQKGSETSLIERFLYPKFGPGQMWEEVARQVIELGGTVTTDRTVDRVEIDGQRIVAVWARDGSGMSRRYEGDYFLSTMPIKDLVAALDTEVPRRVAEIANGLVYRDFLTVGLLLDKLKISEDRAGEGGLIKDNWIYIQEPEVRVGRLQIFNNWSPYMVADRTKVWLGLEYFCNEGDDLWSMSDPELERLGREELAKIDIIEEQNVLDAVVIRMPKTYPAYFGSYPCFDQLRGYLDDFENLFLVGRNGMHKYNNQDHSMLTAIMAVENIIAGRTDKSNLWAVNTEEEYHEEKRA